MNAVFAPTVPQAPSTAEAVRLSWLVTVRWAGVAACIGAVIAGAELGGSPTPPRTLMLIAASAATNLWLGWQVRRAGGVPTWVGGGLVSLDVLLLSWLLREGGGVLNPASIFYLVDIVLVPLVLGRTWTWIVTLLSVAGYGVLFLAPPSELTVAGSMHPEIGLHVRGMWLAFAATASIVAVLVSRLASMVERRDRTLEALRERSGRDARLAGLATLSAGAAHELSTPLATIAVTARELELALVASGTQEDTLADVRLIREQVSRCRLLLDDMAARISEPSGEMPTTSTAGRLIDQSLADLTPIERERVDIEAPIPTPVRWPMGVVARALVNIVRNALQASAEGTRVVVRVERVAEDDEVRMVVSDRGPGMAAAVLARAGEPFFTTKPAGKGMGLGLFVARSAVEQLGGRLAIDSREGHGTTVTLTLPSRIDPDVRHE